MPGTPVRAFKMTINIYACKLREKLTSQLRLNNMPFTIIADEVTDTYSNQEVLYRRLAYM